MGHGRCRRISRSRRHHAPDAGARSNRGTGLVRRHAIPRRCAGRRRRDALVAAGRYPHRAGHPRARPVAGNRGGRNRSADHRAAGDPGIGDIAVRAHRMAPAGRGGSDADRDGHGDLGPGIVPAGAHADRSPRLANRVRAGGGQRDHGPFSGNRRTHCGRGSCGVACHFGRRIAFRRDHDRRPVATLVAGTARARAGAQYDTVSCRCQHRCVPGNARVRTADHVLRRDRAGPPRDPRMGCGGVHGDRPVRAAAARRDRGRDGSDGRRSVRHPAAGRAPMHDRGRVRYARSASRQFLARKRPRRPADLGPGIEHRAAIRGDAGAGRSSPRST